MSYFFSASLSARDFLTQSSAMSSICSRVSAPPVKPFACTKMNPLCPETSCSLSPLSPHHSFGAGQRLLNCCPSTAGSDCILQRPLCCSV